MRKFQLAGQILFPAFIAFIALQFWTRIQESFHSEANIWLLLLYGAMLGWSISIFFKRNMLHIHIGFKDLPREWLMLLQFVILVSLIVGHSKIDPALYLSVTPLTITVFGIITSTLTILLTKIVSVHTIFIKVTPTLYMDLTYSELHTKEDILTYRGVKTLIEDLSVENLLLTSNYLKNKETKDMTIEISEMDGKLHIQCFENGILQWKDTYSAVTIRPEDKHEIRNILRKIG